MGGFSLFGTSGDKTTTSNTTNVTNDTTTTTTTTDSNNITNNLNTALTQNKSFITNDSKIQNTALQLTDAFNRFANYNFANVGNTTIGAPPPVAVSDYASFFKNVPQATMNQTPVDLSKPLLDFNTLSGLSVQQLKAITGLNDSVQTGFTNATRATGATVGELAANTTGAATAAAGMSTTIKIVLAAAAVVIVFLLVRRR